MATITEVTKANFNALLPSIAGVVPTNVNGRLENIEYITEVIRTVKVTGASGYATPFPDFLYDYTQAVKDCIEALPFARSTVEGKNKGCYVPFGTSAYEVTKEDGKPAKEDWKYRSFGNELSACEAYGTPVLYRRQNCEGFFVVVPNHTYTSTGKLKHSYAQYNGMYTSEKGTTGLTSQQAAEVVVYALTEKLRQYVASVVARVLSVSTGAVRVINGKLVYKVDGTSVAWYLCGDTINVQDLAQPNEFNVTKQRYTTAKAVSVELCQQYAEATVAALRHSIELFVL